MGILFWVLSQLPIINPISEKTKTYFITNQKGYVELLSSPEAMQNCNSVKESYLCRGSHIIGG